MSDKLQETMFSELKTFLDGQSRTIRNIISILFVFVMEALITTEGIFICPVEHHARYGWFFILMPAIILGTLSVMLSEDFLNLVQGICYWKGKARKQRKCLRWNLISTNDCTFFVVLYNGFAAASLWLFWAFLQGRYYQCAKEGNEKDKLRPFKPPILKTENKTKTYEIEKRFLHAKAESQIIGIGLIFGWVIFCTVILTIIKCCGKKPVSSIEDPAEEFYRIEETEAVKTYKEKLDKLARETGKRKAERMFEGERSASKSPTEMLRDVFNKLKTKSGYEGAFTGEYDEEAAAHYRKAFDEKQKTQATADIEAMTKPLVTSDESKKTDYFSLTEDAYRAMIEEYPRATGDRSQPYVKPKKGDNAHNTIEEGGELDVLTAA